VTRRCCRDATRTILGTRRRGRDERGEAHINLRFLHYPPQESDDDEQFGQGPHTDNSFVTILARMDVPGLAVRLPSGEWLAPPLIPGTFLVNLGNMMKRWSNDRFLSTPHGVLNDSGADRYSIAFFYSPSPDAAIECLLELRRRGQPAPVPSRDLSRSGAGFLQRQLLSPPGLHGLQPRAGLNGPGLSPDTRRGGASP
jgi:isopenicillin N synthase-like dioxygenase